MSKDLVPVIGLEIHVQQKTKSKMFCSCSNKGDDLPPNTTVCPICIGHPGTLPVANMEAVKWSVKAAMAINCEIPEYSKFDRKHYFYPDLPKAYQISQLDQPIGQNGWLKILDPDTKEMVKIHINRLHLEEDAAKNTHTKDGTLVDYNRGGTPLMEIVSEPDIQSSTHAKAYMQEIRLIMRYLGVSDADMEKGHLRCDANISLKPENEQKLYPKTEIKNLNSFSNIAKAIDFEIQRQTQLWEEGNPPTEETTRGWNDAKGITEAQRSKEGAQDYRYFPEPDLPPMHFIHDVPNSCNDLPEDEINVTCIRAELPELPYEKRQRFLAEYGLGLEDVITLVNEDKLAKFIDPVISELENWTNDLKEINWDADKKTLVQQTVNWTINRLNKLLADNNTSLSDSKLTAENYAELMLLLATNKLNSTNGQKVLEIMVEKGGDASQIMIDHDLGQMSDTGELEALIDEVIAANKKSVEDYKAGKEKALQALVGQIMGKTKGKANPQAVLDLLKSKLSN